MKIKGTFTLCLVLLVSILCCPTASATQKISLQNHSMTLQLPNDFTILTQENVNQYKDLLY